MSRCAILLRGINIGPNNRIPMAELRSLLTQDGFADVATYLQSGNVVLSSTGSPDAAARRCESLIAQHFGLQIGSVVRTHGELEAVMRADPLPEAAANPKGYQVTFLASAPDPSLTSRLAAVATPAERFAVIGREIYAWHPEGIARSRLATLLAGRALTGTATARNWITVTALLSLTAD
ncbi:MAG: DUF1697 domain-containing protein [Candidatus Dormibacteria bacterium]|jgi:uncharacterized protein (DUF1697 family)